LIGASIADDLVSELRLLVEIHYFQLSKQSEFRNVHQFFNGRNLEFILIF
jgi:hypothetical protein